MDLLPLITALHTLGVSETCAGHVLYTITADLTHKAARPSERPVSVAAALSTTAPETALLNPEPLPRSAAPRPAAASPATKPKTKSKAYTAEPREFFAISVAGHRSTVGLPKSMAAQLIARLGSKAELNAQVRAWAAAAEGKPNAAVRAKAEALLADKQV